MLWNCQVGKCSGHGTATRLADSLISLCLLPLYSHTQAEGGVVVSSSLERTKSDNASSHRLQINLNNKTCNPIHREFLMSGRWLCVLWLHRHPSTRARIHTIFPDSEDLLTDCCRDGAYFTRQLEYYLQNIGWKHFITSNIVPTTFNVGLPSLH